MVLLNNPLFTPKLTKITHLTEKSENMVESIRLNCRKTIFPFPIEIRG